jgi:hypothetical protein
VTATYNADNRLPAAKVEIDGARGHADTAICLLDSAIEHLDGARRTRAQEILDRVSTLLADLDRLRAAL